MDYGLIFVGHNWIELHWTWILVDIWSSTIGWAVDLKSGRSKIHWTHDAQCICRGRFVSCLQWDSIILSTRKDTRPERRRVRVHCRPPLWRSAAPRPCSPAPHPKAGAPAASAASLATPPSSPTGSTASTSAPPNATSPSTEKLNSTRSSSASSDTTSASPALLYAFNSTSRASAGSPGAPPSPI
jgi:hypothetical protein